MGAKNKVIAGSYIGCAVIILGKNLAIPLEFFNSYPISKDSLESYRVIEKEEGTNGTSATFVDTDGNVIMGTASGTPGVYTIALNFKDGKRSLVEIDTKRYKVFQKAMFEANLEADEHKAETKSVSDADELIKWKGLLDQGVITAEEFEAKKKQLLGL